MKEVLTPVAVLLAAFGVLIWASARPEPLTFSTLPQAPALICPNDQVTICRCADPPEPPVSEDDPA